MNPIPILQELVAINSVNPDCLGGGPGEAECARFVADLARRHGLDVQLQEVLPGRPNVLVHLAGPDPGKRLVLEAHMDTVAASGMSIPPFEPTVRDGRLFGRGACDTKASLAAMLAALVAAKESRGRRASVTLAATVDEEHGFRGVGRFARDCGPASGAVVGEPTRMDVVIAHRGLVRWRLVVHGRAAHTSRPDLGINAISKVARLVTAIEEEWLPLVHARSHPLLGHGEMTVSLIAGGTQFNLVPDQCTIGIDRRILPGESRESVFAEQETLLKKLQNRDPQLQVSVSEDVLEDCGLETDAGERIVTVARAACRLVGGSGELTTAPYGTDASKLARAGIPSIVLGPGDPAQAHTADEWVEVQQVESAAEVYRRIMEEF